MNESLHQHSKLTEWTKGIRTAGITLAEMVKGRIRGITASSRLREDRNQLDWSETAARYVRSRVEEELRRSNVTRPTIGAITGRLTDADCHLVEEILERTKAAGRSNITRTEAYLEVYQAYPELHWALLAHLVSRNAGWNMSDLQGEQADPFLTEADKTHIYRLLERSNALIFQDAYPQLLLYIKSRELGRSYFHLLSSFDVSRFMVPFWERFWIDRGSALLSVGLIINEQHYIHDRVVRHPHFQKTVLQNPIFKLNGSAGLNQVVFPLQSQYRSSRQEEELKLAGRILQDFAHLPSRIEFGKHLYALLFGLTSVRNGAERFANSIPHTGSRADYWPHLFTSEREKALSPSEQETELIVKHALPKNRRIYSPALLDVWDDTSYEPISREDWLRRPSAINGIAAPSAPYLCEITEEHRTNLIKRAAAHDVSVTKQE